jgi:hypothetical protein
MTTDDIPPPPEPPLSPLDADDALAAEYVLGVLSLTDRSAVEARLKNDSAFVARVAAWENRLSPLNDDYAEVPAPDLMPRIEARLFPVAEKPARRPLFGWLSGAATAAAIAIAAVVMFTPPAPPPVVATLGEADASLRFEARFDGQALTVTRVSGTARATGPGAAALDHRARCGPGLVGSARGRKHRRPLPRRACRMDAGRVSGTCGRIAHRGADGTGCRGRRDNGAVIRKICGAETSALHPP